MENALGFLKWIVIAVIVGVVVYIGWRVVSGIGSLGTRLSDAFKALGKDWTSLKSKVTPGWSSIVPTPGSMPPEMAAQYAAIKAAEPNLNTENPNLPWYERAIGVHNFFGFDLAPATPIKTFQTVGTSPEQYNLPPASVANVFVPGNQPGQTPLGDTMTTGNTTGSTMSNAGPVVGSLSFVNKTSIPPASSQAGPAVMPNNGPNPGVATAATPGIDTSQLQFIGQ